VTTTIVVPRLAQLKDQVVEQPGADRIETLRRLVEEENFRIQRHRPCDPARFCIPPLI
jgi:hypothetical protein